ncbi:MAG TPA: RHS repeat-associated core domain-containing protein [Caulobacteraceae bacterium]|jgi:RHS repeat-associated protein
MGSSPAPPPTNQGSIAAYSDATGDQAAAYGYGPYGEPGAWSGSRYAYTGQLMIPENSLYNYMARVYDPTFGRFLQTDPIGYASDINAYAYVHNDPANRTDPLGTANRSNRVSRRRQFLRLRRREPRQFHRCDWSSVNPADKSAADAGRGSFGHATDVL